MAIKYGSLPFQEQIDFHQAKNPVPTKRWNDLKREQHDIGFMVAGAIKSDLLADLKEAMRKVHENGDTLRDFRKNFDAIVKERGWTGWTGSDSDAGRAWRTRVIYETNLRTAYMAGRWQQVQAVKKHRPYLIYRHSDSVASPRAQHLAWDGLVVSVDDPWVKTHWPPNGYGCRCDMDTLSISDLKKMGKTGPDTPPDDGTYDWTDPKTGEIHTFPNGIGPFWDYAPGASVVDRVRGQIERKLPGLPEQVAKQLKAEIKAGAQRGAGQSAISQALADSFNQAIDFVLKLGRDLKRNARDEIEFAYVYDEIGKVLVKRRGATRKIEFTAEDIAKMQEAKGVTIVHNHPGDGWSLSQDDLLFGHRVDAEVHAITHNNVHYAGKVLDITRLKSQYDVIDNKMYELIKQQIAAQAVAEAAAHFYQDHVLNTALADLGIIEYSASGANLPPALAPVLAKLVAEFK